MTWEKRINLSWGDYIGAVNMMMTRCEKHIENLTEYTILAIGRGGLIPAQMLAYRINTKNLVMIGAESYSGHQRGTVRIHSTRTPWPLGCNPDKILIVDDLVDSGNTIAAMHHWVETSCDYGQVEIKSAVAYLKDSPRRVCDPDYHGRCVPDVWVQFPYER